MKKLLFLMTALFIVDSMYSQSLILNYDSLKFNGRNLIYKYDSTSNSVFQFNYSNGLKPKPCFMSDLFSFNGANEHQLIHSPFGVFINNYGKNSLGLNIYCDHDSGAGQLIVTYGKFSPGLNIATTGYNSKGIISTTTGSTSNGVESITKEVGSIPLVISAKKADTLILADKNNQYIFLLDGQARIITNGSFINNVLRSFSSGGVYSLTSSYAPILLPFNKPTDTLKYSGTYLLKARLNIRYTGCTFSSNRTLTLKLRRINNGQVDLLESATSIITDVVANKTGNFAVIETPEIPYTVTLNGNDIIQIWGFLSAPTLSGTLDVVEASILAIKLY